MRLIAGDIFYNFHMPMPIYILYLFIFLFKWQAGGSQLSGACMKWQLNEGCGQN